MANFLASNGGNILEADQHTDADQRQFFMRVEIEEAGFALSQESFAHAWDDVATKFEMQWRISWGHERKRMAIFVSKETHCVSDLLWRWRTGELEVDVPFVAGNHAELEETAGAFGIPFHYMPVTKETRADQEVALRSLLEREQVDFVVLARYMQILSPEFVEAYRGRIINIHHSFLPAFAGPRPYHQAFERGVKIIGATSHYVTEDLDQGPIIAQSVAPVDHRDALADLVRTGRDLERMVLSTAVRLHVEDKILVRQNKTVVFD